MIDDIPMLECRGCKKIHPETLYSNRKERVCVYCKADEQEGMPQPAAPEPVKSPELTVKEHAQKELASRILSRKRLLPFVEKFNPDYNAGWVHKDVCKRLEQFSRDVVDQKSPRLCYLCLPVMARVRWRRFHSRLGIWAVTLSMSLLVARIRVRLQWALAVRYAKYFVNRRIKRSSRRAWTRIVKVLKRG